MEHWLEVPVLRMQAEGGPPTWMRSSLEDYDQNRRLIAALARWPRAFM